MPIEQEIDAETARIRRMTGDGDEVSHFTLTVEDEAGNSFRARIPPDEMRPELDRYIEERLRSTVEDLDEWFHDRLKEDVNEQLSDLSDTFEEGLGRIKDELNLKRPRSSPDAEDEVSVSDEGGVVEEKTKPL